MPTPISDSQLDQHPPVISNIIKRLSILQLQEKEKLIMNLQAISSHEKKRKEKMQHIKRRVSVLHDNMKGGLRRKTVEEPSHTEDMAYAIKTAHRNYLKMLDQHTESREYRQ